MGNIVVDNTIEFLKDESTGELVGYKRKDGTERGIATTVTDPLTGGSVFSIQAAGQTLVVYVSPSGDTTGATDKAAIQAAHDALPSSGGMIRLTAGVFYIDSQIAITKSVKIEGAGGGIAGDAGAASSVAPTTINCLSSTANGFSISAAGCTLRDFALINTSGTTPTAGAGILSTQHNTSTIDSLTVLGFYNLLDLGGVYYSVTNCRFYDAVNYYLYHHSPGTTYDDHGDFTIANNVFSGWKKSHTAVAQIRWETGGGIKILGNKFNSGGQPGNLSAGVSAYCMQFMIADGKTTGSLVITGNSISGWASNTGNLYIGQLGPTKDGRFSSLTIVGNEFAVSAQGITIEGNATYDDRIRGVHIAANTFFNISGSCIKVRYVRQCHIGTNLHTTVGSPIIDVPDLASNCINMRIDRQQFGEASSKVVVRDNRSIGNTVTSLAGGVEYDYTHGIAISTNGAWTQVFKIEVSNQQAGTFDFEIDGRSTDTTNTSPNRKGVCIRQSRTYDVSSAGAVTLSTIGTDVAAGAASTFVAVRYTLTTNWIAVEVQTTDATNCVLWGAARLKVNGKLQTFHVGT